MRRSTSNRNFRPENYSGTNLDKDAEFVKSVNEYLQESEINIRELSREHRDSAANLLFTYLNKPIVTDNPRAIIAQLKREYQNANFRLNFYGRFVRAKDIVEEVENTQRSLELHTFPLGVDSGVANNGKYGYDHYVGRALEILNGAGVEVSRDDANRIFYKLSSEYEKAKEFIQKNPFDETLIRRPKIEQLELAFS